MWSENRTSFKPIKADQMKKKKYRKCTPPARSPVRNRQDLTTEQLRFVIGLTLWPWKWTFK